MKFRQGWGLQLELDKALSKANMFKISNIFTVNDNPINQDQKNEIIGIIDQIIKQQYKTDTLFELYHSKNKQQILEAKTAIEHHTNLLNENIRLVNYPETKDFWASNSLPTILSTLVLCYY